MAEASVMYASLDGLDKALEIQGGMKGPAIVRDDAGVYLYHEVGDYLSRKQTYQVCDSISILTPGAGDAAGTLPNATGLRYGRYLIGLGLSADNVTNLTGWGVYLRNSGIQPGYPITTSPAPFMFGGSTARQVNASTFILVPDPQPVSLPLWCPPGTYAIVYLRTAAASGTYVAWASWHTSEMLNQAGTAPAGLPQAPVKV